jgi:hypothetical protein
LNYQLPHPLPPETRPRPATLVDGIIIFPGGTSRPATRAELAAMARGERITANPSSGRRTWCVGERYGALGQG